MENVLLKFLSLTRKRFFITIVAGLAGLFIIINTNQQQIQISDEQKSDLNTALAEEHSDLGLDSVVSSINNIRSDSLIDGLTEKTVIKVKEVGDVEVTEEVIDFSINEKRISDAERLLEQQIEYQLLLEQKATGQIQVMGPLITEVTSSKEFLALTQNQQHQITSLILNRLISGELRPEDAFPGWPK